MKGNVQEWVDALRPASTPQEAPILPIEQHVAACAAALEAARSRAEIASVLLRTSPRNAEAMNETLTALCDAWVNASNAYEAYQQILNCRGQG